MSCDSIFPRVPLLMVHNSFAVTVQMWMMIAAQAIYQTIVALVLHFAGKQIFHFNATDVGEQLDQTNELNTVGELGFSAPGAVQPSDFFTLALSVQHLRVLSDLYASLHFRFHLPPNLMLMWIPRKVNQLKSVVLLQSC